MHSAPRRMLSKPSLLNWGRVLREAAPWRDRSAPDVLSRGRPLCSSRERALSWMQLRRTKHWALSVIKKPDPRQPVDEAHRTKAYDDAMIENRDALIRDFESAIHRASLWYKYKAQLPGFVSGVVSSAFVWFVTWWITRAGWIPAL